MELLDLFRLLSSFSPARRSLEEAPWDAYVDWAISNGLAPLAAYNLEYRLMGGGAPEWVRDRLLSVYQGTANDNVMKLVTFKRAVGGLEGRRLLLFGAACYAEGLYPHVAFRPVPEVKLRVGPEGVGPLSGYLKGHGYKPLRGDDWEGATAALTDDHTPLLLYADLLGPRRAEAEAALVSRGLPVKVYGPSVVRPDLEDAVLLSCLELARAGFDAPFISFVDLRELLLGASSLAGVYSRAPDLAQLRERASRWRIHRAVYSALGVVGRLFPETRDACAQATPQLGKASRALLDRWVVTPVSTLGRVAVTRGADRLRRLLAGG